LDGGAVDPSLRLSPALNTLLLLSLISTEAIIVAPNPENPVDDLTIAAGLDTGETAAYGLSSQAGPGCGGKLSIQSVVAQTPPALPPI
jgi:hypothetical protein